MEELVGLEYRTPPYLGDLARQYTRTIRFIDTPDGIDMLIKQLNTRRAALKRASAGTY